MITPTGTITRTWTPLRRELAWLSRMALVAASLMARKPTERRTWGWARMEVLAAGAQATLLLVVGIYALIEGVRRLFGPVEVEPTWMLFLGIAGLIANLSGRWP